MKQSQNVNPRLLAKQALIQNRIILLFDEIASDTVQDIIEDLFLLAQISTEPVTIFINTEGGSVVDGLALYDTMKMLPIEIKTICIGQAASMGATILAGGTKGKRYIMPHGRVLIHQITSRYRGKLSEMKTDLKEIERLEHMCNLVLANDTGQPIRKIEKDQEKDFWMSADEAIEYGIADHKLEKVDRRELKLVGQVKKLKKKKKKKHKKKRRR